MKRVLVLVISAFIFIGTARADDPLDAPVKTALQDGEHLFTAPMHWDDGQQRLALGAGLLVGGSLFLDHAVFERMYPNRKRDSSTDQEAFGNKAQFAVPAMALAFGAGGKLFGNEHAEEAGYLIGESWALSAGVSGLMKLGFNRRQPYKTSNAFDFKWGHNDYAFPSGHTTVAFAGATALSLEYPHPIVVIPAMAAATAVGVSRLSANKHWLSDVVAGGMLGAVIPYALHTWHKESRDGKTDQRLSIEPDGLHYTMAF